MEKPLRFAPLVRVSTEGQAKRGESLRTQKQQIVRAVEQLGGVLIDDPWRYSGQEHATEGFEREKLDQLLKASANGGDFGAVIVADPSRWSRDNLKNEEGLRMLQKNGIRFFVGTTEHDLYDPTARLFLAMNAAIHQYQIRHQNKKSIENRIARAKRGLPTSGKLPYGRTFDKATGQWGIDKEKRQKIVYAAERYLAGESILKLATELGMNHAALWKTLTRRSGTEWQIRYRSKELGMDETVTLEIPPLLPKSTIEKVLKRAQTNKTFTHGVYKYNYLLARMVFCGGCGYAMFGQTNHHHRQYYRHPRGRVKPCGHGPGFWVPAAELDQAVFLRLFALGGDQAGLEAAMQRAIPNADQLDTLLEQQAVLEKQLKANAAEKERIVLAIGKGVIDDEDAAERMRGIREQKATLENAIAKIAAQTKGIPSAATVKTQASLAKRSLEAIFSRPGRMAKMSFEEKRKLVQTFFDGYDAEGRRLGVYVKRTPEGTVHYTIRGVLGAFEGVLEPEGTDPIQLAETGLPLEFAEEIVKASKPSDTEGLKYTWP